MRVRMKFSKTGNVKYIGHLDLMRYFQKLIRRAQIPIAYSAGMSPHQIMSFALPLGIGDESLGEYVDIEVTESVRSTDALNALSAQSAEGIRILSFRELPEKALNAMASVEAADYEILCDKELILSLNDQLNSFMEQDEIVVTKHTKKSVREIDIKPFVFRYSADDDRIRVMLKCGSVDNTKPELFMEAFCAFLGRPFDDMAFSFKRIDLYTAIDGAFVSLDDIGSDI